MAALRRMHVSRKPFQLTAPTSPEHQAQIDCTTMLQRVLGRRSAGLRSTTPTASTCGRPSMACRWGYRGAETQGARRARGIPDYLFWAAGQGYGIEFKTGDGTLSDDQRNFLRELIAAKVEVAVCWGSVQVFRKVHEWGLVRPSWDSRMSADRALAGQPLRRGPAQQDASAPRPRGRPAPHSAHRVQQFAGGPRSPPAQAARGHARPRGDATQGNTPEAPND